jgi:hypothetical protein
MKILAHSQIGGALNSYAHVAPETARDAADRIEGALWDEATVAKRPPWQICGNLAGVLRPAKTAPTPIGSRLRWRARRGALRANA